jgi:predicted Zn-dependent protease
MVEALGIFALCAALHGDAEALGRAQQRLKEAEASPYYAILAQSVAALRATQTSRALAGLQGLLATHPADGLTRYFLGEAEYTAGDEAAARQSFSAALTAWPLHAPAMMALSQLEAGGEASEAALARAIALMEQATKIDPGNRTYWQWLAALCERAGQTGRAQAIALQRLQAWQPPAPR